MRDLRENESRSKKIGKPHRYRSSDGKLKARGVITRSGLPVNYEERLAEFKINIKKNIYNKGNAAEQGYYVG